MSDPRALGPFGGTLDGDGREHSPPALRAALVTAAGGPRVVPPLSTLDAATVAPFSVEPDGALRHSADLRLTVPWSPQARSASLDALARVARALAALHARGVVHGDLRPAMLRLDAHGAPALLIPAHASAPGALLRARLHPGGEDPACVGFVAPEVLAGFECTAASDTYALAALTYAALTGFTPVGQVNLRPFTPTPEGALAQAVEAALNQSPASRPPLDALARALDDAADSLTRSAPDASQAYRVSFSSAAEASAAQRAATDLSPGLLLVLIVGGLCAFLGAVLLVSAGWGVVGEPGRVAMLAALTALSLGAGQLASSRGLSTGAAVARALGGLFGAVAVGYSFYLLNDAGRLGLLVGLCALSLASGALASRRGAPLAGVALLALGSQLGWAVGAQAIHMTQPEPRARAVSALAAAVSALTWVLARRRRSFVVGALGALDLAVFFAAFGVWLERGAVMGLAMYSLAASAAYLLLARLAVSEGSASAATPYAGGGVVAAAVSVLAGLYVMSDQWLTHGLAGAGWPYLVAVAALCASGVASPVGPSARFIGLATLTLVPTIEALGRSELGFTVVAVVLGLGLLLAAALSPSLRDRGEARTELMLAGLLGVVAAPTLRTLSAIDHVGREGDPSAGEVWITLSAASLALLLTSYGLTGRVQRGQHRMLEVVGLGPLFALLTLRVLADPTELLPALIALGSSAGAAALGFATRRASVMLIGVTALLVNLWVQYFARLAGVFPVSVRLVGFGVGLLLGGVIYEQTLRRRVGALKEWD